MISATPNALKASVVAWQVVVAMPTESIPRIGRMVNSVGSVFGGNSVAVNVTVVSPVAQACRMASATVSSTPTSSPIIKSRTDFGSIEKIGK